MPAPLLTQRFNHAALNTTDVARSVDFYERVFGMRVVERPDFDFEGAWLYRDEMGVMLHLIKRIGFESLPAGINSRTNHLAFRVSNVDEAIETLEALGIEYQSKRLPTYGYRQVFFQDPDGNVLEVGEWPDVEQMVDRD